MLVPVIHFLEDVSLVLLELTQSVCLNLLDLVSLSLKLGVKFLNKLTLLLQPLFLLRDDGLFNLLRFLSQVLQDLTLFLDSGIFLSFQVNEIFVHLSIDWSKLVVQTLNTIASLLGQHVFKVCHAIVAALILALLVFVLSVELVVHLNVQVFELLIIFDLVGLERIIDFLALINSILLDVLNLPMSQKVESVTKMSTIVKKIDKCTYW